MKELGWTLYFGLPETLVLVFKDQIPVAKGKRTIKKKSNPNLFLCLLAWNSYFCLVNKFIMIHYNKKKKPVNMIANIELAKINLGPLFILCLKIY